LYTDVFLNTAVFVVKEKNMKSVRYLEQVRATLPKQTDQALADVLNISKGAVSHYVTGRRVMDEETCLAVAIQLDINPMEVMMAAGIDRAEKAGQQSLWSVFSQRMAATAASAVLAVGVNFILTPQNAEACTYSPASSQQGVSVYIM
jgi:hypothetical protein